MFIGNAAKRDSICGLDKGPSDQEEIVINCG